MPRWGVIEVFEKLMHARRTGQRTADWLSEGRGDTLPVHLLAALAGPGQERSPLRHHRNPGGVLGGLEGAGAGRGGPPPDHKHATVGRSELFSDRFAYARDHFAALEGKFLCGEVLDPEKYLSRLPRWQHSPAGVYETLGFPALTIVSLAPARASRRFSNTSKTWPAIAFQTTRHPSQAIHRDPGASQD